MFRPVRILLALVVAAALASSADAAEVYPSVSPTVLHGTPPWQVTYRLEFDTGPLPERLVLESTGAVADLGVDGPGTVTRVAAVMVVLPERLCIGGMGSAPADALTPAGQSWWLLDLPPNSATTLTMRVSTQGPFDLGRDAFDSVSFATGPVPDGYRPGDNIPFLTLPTQPIAIPPPAIAVPRYVPIDLSLRTPASRSVPAGRLVPIRGQTSPLLAGRLIELRSAVSTAPGYTRAPKFTPLARVRVAPDGSFAYLKWRPRTAGRWSIGAFYDSHDPGMLDSVSRGCFPFVSVGPSH